MKICPKCECEYEDVYAFCPKCGSKLFENAHCPKCNKIIVENYAFCPYCGHELKNVKSGSVFSNTKKNVLNKKTIRASTILYEMLEIGQNASVRDITWQKFGFGGYPQYQSKFSILRDINNVKINFFLIQEIMCMSAGIGIHKFLETCCPDNADAGNCISKVILLASNEPSLEKVFQLNRPDVKKRFDSLISDYVLTFAFAFSNMNNANPQFTKIFMKHAELSNVNIKGIYQGASYLADYFISYYGNRMEEFEDYEIVNDLSL